jgi:Uncharacterised nucleotidyltransferase
MVPGAHILAVLKALSFERRSTRELEAISTSDWPALLDALDRSHLTLAVGTRCRDSLPDFVRKRIDRNLVDNALRHARLVETQREICESLRLSCIPFVVLKGLAHSPGCVDDPRTRPQYDIDIYSPCESIPAALRNLQGLGYEATGNATHPGADHLPIMIRRTGWKWRGDYYDPDMPPSLELHFRFWNSQYVRFGVGDVTQFWRRRTVRQSSGLDFPALDPGDALSFSAMHLMHHSLGGDLHLRHVYEVAHFLERSAGDVSFWSHWRDTGLQECRVVEGIAFQFAREWFGCHLNAAAQDAIDQLPASVKRWFSIFALSPALALEKPNKNELWLHFCLATRARDQYAIARRRLIPARAGRVLLDPHAPGAPTHKRLTLEASFLAKRILHHLRTLLPTLHGAYLWWSRGNRPA